MDNIPKTIWAALLYLVPDPAFRITKPYYIAGMPPQGAKQTNEVFAPTKTEIFNARRNEEKFSIDRTGFEWVHHPLDWALDSSVAYQKYMRVMEHFLKHHLGAESVYAYDYVIREQRERGFPSHTNANQQLKSTIMTTHIDITPSCALEKVRAHLSIQQAERLLEGKWQIINAWRPLVDRVESQPLAVCDSNSLNELDLIACNVIYPQITTEIYHLLPSSEQKWYYMRDQKREEVLLMRNYCSSGAIGTAHTAFNDPSADPKAPARRSIELRCFVSYPL